GKPAFRLRGVRLQPCKAAPRGAIPAEGEVLDSYAGPQAYGIAAVVVRRSSLMRDAIHEERIVDFGDGQAQSLPLRKEGLQLGTVELLEGEDVGIAVPDDRLATEFDQRILPHLAPVGVEPDRAHEQLDGCAVLAGVLRVALDLEEARHIGKLTGKGAFYLGRRPFPGQPKNPLYLSPLPGGGAARSPSQEGTGIALVVADGSWRSWIELAGRFGPAVLAEIPLRLFAEIGGLEGQHQGLRTLPEGGHRDIRHDGAPDGLGDGARACRGVRRYLVQWGAAQGALDAKPRFCANTSVRHLARRNHMGRALAAVVEDALQVALEDREWRVSAGLHAIAVSIHDNGVGRVRAQEGRKAGESAQQQPRCRSDRDISLRQSVGRHAGIDDPAGQNQAPKCRRRRSIRQ